MNQPARQEPSESHVLSKEMRAAQILMEQLKLVLDDERAELDAEDDDNSQVLLDTVEGETNLLEAVDTVLQRLAVLKAYQEAIKKAKQNMDARAARFAKSEESLRTMIANALEIIEQRKLERPLATVSLTQVAPKCTVTQEADIPSDYWKQPDPVLDKKKLTDALKVREKVIEAQLEVLTKRLHAGEITMDERAALASKVFEENPPIPGAELGNGGVTVTVRFA